MPALSNTIPYVNLIGMVRALSILQLIAVAVIIILARWIARGLYRVYFHPLARFPGPKLCAFTHIPHVYAIATGSVHMYVSKLHVKYGDVVRISPDELSFISPQAWRDIYGYGAKGSQGSPPPKHFLKYTKAVTGVDSLLTEPTDEEHARLRHIFSPAFSERALTQQAPLFTRYVDQLVQLLKDHVRASPTGTATVDLVHMYNFTTFDIMGDLTFGEPLHMLDKAEYNPWVRIVFGALKIGVRINLIHAHYPILSKVIKLVLEKRILKIRWIHFNFSSTRVTRRLEKGRASEGIDLWDLVLSQQDKGKEGLSREQMDVNASLFMIAGTETTATLLSGLTYLLLTHQHTLHKLVAEIRSAFADSKDISLEALARLPYLKACISEAFRMYPPVPGGAPRLTPKDGSTICGEWVPPGITVAAHHLAMYSSPKTFREPRSFVPERWMGDARYMHDDRAALQPFSVGSRDCIGRNMAYHEIRLIIAKVLYNFDLELGPGNENWLDQSVYTVWEKKSLMVKVRIANAE